MAIEVSLSASVLTHAKPGSWKGDTLRGADKK